MALIEGALQRLDTALSRLEAAVTRRVEQEAARGDRDIELMLLEEDRTRLAAELDAASAQLARMAAVTGDVERRIERAIGAVEGVLDQRQEQRQEQRQDRQSAPHGSS